MRVVLSVLLLALTGCDVALGLDREGTDVAILAGYDHRKRIRIVSTAEASLAQFPVALILESDPDLMAGVRDGRDFAVTSADGETQLALDLERWDPTTGDLLLWVKVPVLAAAGETTVYLYFGGEPQGVVQATTWSDAYAGVWHLSGTEREEKDSTRNGQRLTADTDVPGSEPSPLGTARTFDGSAERFLTPPTPPLDAGAESFSSSMWINVKASRGSSDMPLFKGGAAATQSGYDYELGTGSWQAQISDGTTRLLLKLGTEDLARTWRQLAAVVDREAGVASAYLDGQLMTTIPLAGLGSLSSGDYLRIGGAATPFEGSIDELRLYHGVWSADWIATEYRNIREIEQFLLVSDVEILR